MVESSTPDPVGLKRGVNIAGVFYVDNLHIVIGILAGLGLALMIPR